MNRIILIAAISLFTATGVFGKNMYVPAAGYTPGANGTFFRTDLRVFNPSATTNIDVTLHFLPQDLDGRNISGRVFHIGKRETLVLDNVVATLIPGQAPLVGAIRIDSDTDASYEFIASSRTYTNSPNPSVVGTYGQFVPARDPADARTNTVLLHVTNRPEFRTNAGAMNPGQEPATVKAFLLGADGVSILESAPMVVPPMSMRQWSMLELFGGVFIVDGAIVFQSDVPVFTWASVIDNSSGDPLYVIGVEDKDGISPLPLP